MIESVNELFLEVNEHTNIEGYRESLFKHIEDKLNLSMSSLTDALAVAVIENAEEISTEFVNIAPLGDYSKIIESNEDMIAFLKEEAHKPEHWKLVEFDQFDKAKKLITFRYDNYAVDDGDTLKGFVYVSFDGKIKHAFAQGE